MTKKILIYPWFLLTLFIIVYFLVLKKDKNESTDFDKVVYVSNYLLNHNLIKNSSFSAIYPSKKPSEYIKYLFSPFGSSLWPPSSNEFDKYEQESKSKDGIPIIPSDYKFTHDQKNNKYNKQVVLSANDELGIIIIEIFNNPNSSSAYRDSIKFHP